MATVEHDAPSAAGTDDHGSRRRAALVRLVGLVLLLALVAVVVDQGDLLGLPAFALTLVVWVLLLASSLTATGWRAAHDAWPRVRELGAQLAQAVGQEPEVRWLRDLGTRLPDALRPAGRAGGRLVARAAGTVRRDPGNAAWLLVAGACVVGLVALWIVVRGEPPAFDRRVVDLSTELELPLVRDVMLAVTSLGDPLAATVTVALLGTAAWRWAGRDAALLAVAPPALAPLATSLLKMLVERQRPAIGQLAETSHSWPSGHATLGLSLALGVVLLAGHVGVRWRGVAAVVVPVGLLVGYSRAYLSVHWTSDVVSGWLVALLVASLVALVVGVGSDRPAGPPSSRRVPGWVVAVLVVLQLGVAVRGAGTVLERPPDEPPTTVAGTDPVLPALAQDPRTRTLLGRPLAPVNVVLAADDATVDAALDQAGWVVADRPTPLRSLTAALARLRSTPDPTAPVAPAFHDVHVQSMAALQDTPGADGARHRLRLWRQGTVLGDGCTVWFGAAALDRQAVGLVAAFLSSTGIDPAIDVQRAFVTASLVDTGLFEADDPVAVLPPTLGDHAGGGQFFTDGAAAVLRQSAPCAGG